MQTLSEFFQTQYGWSPEVAQDKARYFAQPLDGPELQRKIQIGAEYVSWLGRQ